MWVGLSCAVASLALGACDAGGSNKGETGAGATGGTGPGFDGGLAAAPPFDGGGDDDGGVTSSCPGQAESFIWIANTGEGTLSKVNTVSGVEVARYITSPQGAAGDPSRTSVNLHGDMVVTNRDPASGPSSVTKFAGALDDCVDRDDDGNIHTSTGPSDVKPWGEDECMIWNTPLGSGGSIGARATAWDGREDEQTGEGGHVYIGAVNNRTIYKLDGETGAILDQAVTAIGHYGGAIDGKGNFWTVAMSCTVGACSIERTSIDDLTDHDVHGVQCGYGISIDAAGRVWTAGLGCVSRYDPSTGANPFVGTGMMDFNRGVAVGTALSQGFVWAASTNGDLVQVDQDSVQIVRREPVGVQEMVGVAVDCEGYVWTVSKDGNSAYKVHPGTWAVEPVPIGLLPYTYSDMTGMQLRAVTPPPR
jgi:hypothetical protein